MLKKFIPLLFLIFYTHISAQEVIGSFANTHKADKTKITDSYFVQNKKTGETILFLLDNSHAYVNRFNTDLEKIDDIKIAREKVKYKRILGASIEENGNYILYLGNRKLDKFLSITLSFETKEVSSHEFTLLRDYETFTQSFHYQNKFYFLAVSVEVRKVYLYTFDASGKPTRNDFNTGGLGLVNRYGAPSELATELNQKIVSNSQYANGNKVGLIYEGRLTSPEDQAEKTKLYLFEDELILSFDSHPSFTQFLTMDIDSLKFTRKTFEKPYPEISRKKKKSNSLLYDGHLFSISATKKEFTFQVMKLENQEIIKQYSAEKKGTIDFKNSPIYMAGGGRLELKQMEKTNLLLNYLNSGAGMVSVYKKNNQYIVSIGAYNVAMYDRFLITPANFIGGFGDGGIPPEMRRIDCLFDENFNHIPNVETVNPYEEVYAYHRADWYASIYDNPFFGFASNAMRKPILIIPHKNAHVFLEQKGDNNYQFVQFHK